MSHLSAFPFSNKNEQMFHYRRPTKSRRVTPWQPSLKPERFTFPYVALVDFGPLWQLAGTFGILTVLDL